MSDNDSVTYMHPDGFYVIKPKQLNVIPIECPVCIRMMSDADDAAAYRKHACCHDCMLIWAEPNSDSWKNGWRPDYETVKARCIDTTSRIINQFLLS